MLTRSGFDWTASFRPIAEALAVPKIRAAYLDGEIAVMGEDGVTSFAALQDALSRGQGGRLTYRSAASGRPQPYWPAPDRAQGPAAASPRPPAQRRPGLLFRAPAVCMLRPGCEISRSRRLWPPNRTKRFRASFADRTPRAHRPGSRTARNRKAIYGSGDKNDRPNLASRME